MAVSLGTYDATMTIPQFLGLNQYGDEINGDNRYSPDAVNVETIGGVLQPAAACEVLTPELPSPIETLAILYRRWTSSPDKELMIAASGGKLYYMPVNGTEWTELAMPSGVTAFQSNVWSYATYEINPTGSTEPIDVLLISNASDGMYMVRGDNLAVEAIQTPKKFGVIARYAERIWGGAIPDDPDMLVYSAPFDPTDWEADQEIPEDGAGDIQQPSWDGDSFTALHQFGSQLIAFKKTRVWRVLGTDPGEYAFKEQYGGGAPYEKTIAIDTERILMLTDQGVVVYDGLAVNPFQQEMCKDFFVAMNHSALDKASACLWRDKYYLSVPMGNSLINNAVLVYNTLERTWLYRADVSVERFLPAEDCLYFTSSTTPGKIWKWHEDSWTYGQATAEPIRWVTPWMDFGRKDIVKGSHELYVLVEIQDAPVTLYFTIQSEKKKKTKKYTIKPLTSQQVAKNRSVKQKRIHFGGSGRRFRLIIEAEGQPVWRIQSGLLLKSEIDPD